jgi:hypothetical protein
MLLVIGIILVVVGISDFAVAGYIERQQATANPGGLEGEANPVPRLLRMVGIATALAGAVLVVIGLLA